MKVIDTLWFSGRTTTGIVKCEDPWDGIKYYIGAPPFSEYSPNQECDDIQWIVDWGARFPKAAGDLLFGNPIQQI